MLRARAGRRNRQVVVRSARGGVRDVAVVLGELMTNACRHAEVVIPDIPARN
jgi:hypothetical protein